MHSVELSGQGSAENDPCFKNVILLTFVGRSGVHLNGLRIKVWLQALPACY